MEFNDYYFNKARGNILKHKICSSIVMYSFSEWKLKICRNIYDIMYGNLEDTILIAEYAQECI